MKRSPSQSDSLRYRILYAVIVDIRLSVTDCTYNKGWISFFKVLPNMQWSISLNKKKNISPERHVQVRHPVLGFSHGTLPWKQNHANPLCIPEVHTPGSTVTDRITPGDSFLHSFIRTSVLFRSLWKQIIARVNDGNKY